MNGSINTEQRKEGDGVRVSKWAYTPVMCDGIRCAGDCNRCANQPKALSYKTLLTDYEDARKEVCLRCGAYFYNEQTHVCEDCRWRLR